MLGLYVARLNPHRVSEPNGVCVGLCRYYTYLEKDILVCKFLMDDDMIEIFAEPESFEDCSCNYRAHISEWTKTAEEWEVYGVETKKGELKENQLTVENGWKVEIDMSLDLCQPFSESIQLQFIKRRAREKGVPEEIINSIP